MSFQNFCVGDSNRFAYSAALFVVENPVFFNPLVLCGPSGTGKTHLLKAIYQSAIIKNPETRIAYLTAENFTNELLDAIRNGKSDEFRNKYRSIDILLIDNIELVAGKSATQEELFHVFNCLYEAKKQIVVALNGDLHHVLPELEPKIATRLRWGVLTKIDLPDYDTRLAIIRENAKEYALSLSDEEIAYIADLVSGDAGQMIGIVKAIKAQIDLCARSGIRLEDTVKETVDLYASHQSDI